jgi:hypothetical protein
VPIALLLAELTKKRLLYLPVLDNWNRLLSLEETILGRARSAFVVYWFGYGVPVLGTALLIHISNIESLRNQYLWARDQIDVLNVFEPLAGMVGLLVGQYIGVAFSPLAWAFPIVLGVIFAIIGGLAGLAAIGVSYHPKVQAVFRAAGATSGMIDQLLRLWQWITGPRDAIRNPIIRLTLDIVDKISLITAQVAGFIALFFTRVVPYLDRMAVQIPLYYALITATVDALKTVWADFMSDLGRLVSGPQAPHNIIRGILQALAAGLLGTFKRFGAAFGDMVTHLRTAWSLIQTGARAYWTEVSDALRTGIREHPFIAQFQSMIDIFKQVGAILKRTFPSEESSPSPSSLPSPVPNMDEVRRRVEKIAGPEPVLGPGDIPDLAHELTLLREQGVVPDLDAFFSGTLIVRMSGDISTPFSALSPLAQTIREARLRPPSAFGRERRRLEEFAGGPPAQALRQLHERDLYLRDFIGSLLDRTMPASAAGYYARLEDRLMELDRELFGEVPRRWRVVYPVLDLRDDNRLRLEAGRVRVLYRGPRDEGTRELVREFANTLRARFIGTEYRAVEAVAV